MAAYHEARAAGGAGLIIIEAARMHDTALSDGLVLDVSRGETVAGYARVVEAVKRAVHAAGMGQPQRLSRCAPSQVC